MCQMFQQNVWLARPGGEIGEEVFGEQSPAEGDGFCKAEKGTGNV